MALGLPLVQCDPATGTHAEQVGVIGEAIGRPLRYEELAPEVATEELIGHGQPLPVVEDFLLGSCADSVGKAAPVTDTVERVTGLPTRTFARWASDYAEDFPVNLARPCAADPRGRRG
jgi:hypothetical protein